MWFETRVVESFSGMIPTWGVLVLIAVSYLGSVYIIGPAAVLGSLLDRRRIESWPAIVVGGYGLFVTLKPVFGISRPAVEPPLAVESVPAFFVPAYELAVSFSTASFPSGHAIAATLFFGLLAVDLSVSTFRRRLVAALTVVSLVCLSRIGLGVHYPGDVVAGVLLGATFLTVALLLRQRVHSHTFLFVVACIPASGGLITGRPVDVAVLYAAIVLILIGQYLDGQFVGSTHRIAGRSLTPENRK